MNIAKFKILRPIAVTDARLTSTNVPEAVAATYSGATVYALDALVGLVSVYGLPQLVYRSLSAGNVGNALPVPPATTTAFWALAGTVYPAYNSGSSCDIGGIVSSISADVHLLYESLVNANTGNPLTDNTKWLLLGATNAHAMFDAVYGSTTTRPGSIVIAVTPGALVNGIFLGNLIANSVTVSQSISGYSSTVQLNRHNVTNWYDWFYEDIVQTRDVAFLDIPPLPAGVITITIDNGSSNAECGLCVIGKTVTLGETQWDLVGSIISYSGTTTDQFGNTTFVPRANVKRINLEVQIAAGFESEVHRILTEYMDTPLVFIGSSEYAMSLVYGYLGNWEVPISITGRKAPIEIKGLI